MARLTLWKRNNFPILLNMWKNQEVTSILWFKQYTAAAKSSDSVRPHRRQPTRLPRPWDSPGRNTGVGCHFPLQCMRVKSESEVAQSCLTLHDPMDCSPLGSSVHGVFQARVLEWGAIAFSIKQYTGKQKSFNDRAKEKYFIFVSDM